MTHKNILSLGLVSLGLMFAPLAASAMPVVGDVVGTSADAAKAALEKAGCTVDSFEAEDGQIEAICTDAATSEKFDVKIDPATGAVTAVEKSDD